MTDSPWVPEAKAAIDLCATWISNAATHVPGATWWLFGSLILDGGNNFDPQHSDIDLLCVLPEPNSATSRVAALGQLRALKAELELRIIPRLQRSGCDEPAASVVVVTQLELQANVHKSAARSFFTRNVFYDVGRGSLVVGLPTAGVKAISDEQRQAIEYTQAVRNKFLAVCANGTGGLSEFRGLTTLPKALCRAAAQLNTQAAVGEWYDVGLGLDRMMSALRDASETADEFRLLRSKLLRRVGGRPARGPLGPQDQLLLTELLFDIAERSADLESLATCFIRIPAAFEEQQVVGAIRRLAPGAQVLLGREGRGIHVSAPESGIRELRRLSERNVLATVLDVETADFQQDADRDESLSMSTGGRVRELIATWKPDPAIAADGVALERDFQDFVSTSLLESDELHDVRLIASLPGGTDFVLVRADAGSDPTLPVGVELTRIRSRNAFFSRLGSLLDPARRYVAEVVGEQGMLWGFRELVFVVVANQALHDDLAPDVQRITESMPDLRIVPISI